MLQFWLKLQNSSDVQILLSSGDCVTDVRGSYGFCFFYNPKQQSLVAVDIQQDVIKRIDIPVVTEIWTNVLIYFDENSEVYIFQDGTYAGKLEQITSIMFHTRTVTTDIELMYDEDNENITNMRNLTFTAAPPDGVILSAIQGR